MSQLVVGCGYGDSTSTVDAKNDGWFKSVECFVYVNEWENTHQEVGFGFNLSY